MLHTSIHSKPESILTGLLVSSVSMTGFTVNGGVLNEFIHLEVSESW